MAVRFRDSLAWKFTVILVTAGSGIWVIWLMVRVWPEFSARIDQVSLSLLSIGLLLSLGAAYLTFEAFVILVRLFGIPALPRREIGHLYFTTQLLKHLPGRIWGIGYQWAVGGTRRTLGNWVLVNVCHTLLATFFALWSAALALGLLRGTKWVALVLVMGPVAYAMFWLLGSSGAVSRWFAYLPKRICDLCQSMLGLLGNASVSARLRLFLCFAASWLIYYASWFLSGLAYPPLGGIGGVGLCAYYMLAWFVGYVSLLTPSGLGVRELVFVWLAKDYPGDAVALMAVVGRVSLLSVDLILGLLFAPFAPRNQSKL